MRFEESVLLDFKKTIRESVEMCELKILCILHSLFSASKRAQRTVAIYFPVALLS